MATDFDRARQLMAEDEERQRNEMVTVKIPKRLWATVQEQAKRHQESTSATLERAIHVYLLMRAVHQETRDGARGGGYSDDAAVGLF